MVEFVAFHPDNETLGQAFIATIELLSVDKFDPYLSQFGVEDIVPNAWYPQQLELDVLQAIYEAHGSSAMISIGKRIADVAKHPSPVKTIEDALSLLGDGYKHTHRGSIIGYTKHEWLGERSVRIIVHDPYPNDLVLGILWRLVEKYRPDQSSDFVVEYDDPKQDDESGEVYYHLSW